MLFLHFQAFQFQFPKFFLLALKTSFELQMLFPNFLQVLDQYAVLLLQQTNAIFQLVAGLGLVATNCLDYLGDITVLLEQGLFQLCILCDQLLTDTDRIG
jgi:hypothetical protein